jgi:ParB/RepB/Spo0J family partition protein
MRLNSIINHIPPLMEQLQESTQTAAFTPALLGVVRQLELSEIYVAGNYRESIDPTGLVELGQSIKNGGQLQPVLVRRLAEPIEGKTLALVFGFRRYAASEDAQLPTIDAIVKELSAEDALAARIVENLQREVPHPLDEANAVAELTSYGKETAEIASWLGKTARWVAQRRELSKLLAEWKTLLRSDKVSLTAAEELCRWPIDVQERMLTKRYAHSRTEVSTVKGWLTDEMRNLSAAPWKLDDATLVPIAGACSACPKRSSCAIELFPTNEVKKDSCLDGNQDAQPD